jgi:hypothetical protein
VNGKRPDDVLNACFRDIASADGGASDAVLDRLRAEVGSIRRAHVRSLVKMYGLAAALFVAVALPVARLATRPDTSPSSPSAGTLEEVATDFYPLFYSTIPASEPQIVRLEVPRAALASAGIEELAPAGQPLPDMVLADVIVGEDGLARAVRFVELPNTSQQEQQQ